MKTIISLNDIRRTPSLEARITQKSEKLAPFFGGKGVRLQWHCSAKNGIYHVEIDVTAFHLSFHAKSRSSIQLEKALDSALAKIERQVRKRREKRWSSRLESRPYKYPKAA